MSVQVLYPRAPDANIVLRSQNAAMSSRSDHAGELLRARGLRSTPQRRAILGVFQGGAAEHLSADEVYARAADRCPISAAAPSTPPWRSSASWGSCPHPAPSSRCGMRRTRPIIRTSAAACACGVFDLLSGLQAPEEITDPGFSVERIDTRAEGICADCNDYDTGLRAGARAISLRARCRHARRARRGHRGR